MTVDEATGRVFALEPGSVSVFDADTGRVARRMLVSADATALAVDTLHGRLLIASRAPADGTGVSHGAGKLQVVNLRTGAILRTIPVGIAPRAVIVDQQANQVVDSGGGQQAVRAPLAWLPYGLRQRLPFLSTSGWDARTVPGTITVLDLERL